MRAGGKAPANASRALRGEASGDGARSADFATRREKPATTSEPAVGAIATSVAIRFAP